MNIDTVMSKWSSQDARAAFNVAYWSQQYFDINAAGEVVCRPVPARQIEIALPGLVQEIEASGISLPVLIRFQDVLADRVKQLCAAFDKAFAQYAYTAAHTVVYPIKVNQQRCVVEEIAQAMPGRVGLEAGSKPELMAILAQTFYKNTVDDHETIICNGYKDAEYVRLALIGGELGKCVYIVIEQPDELALVLAQAEALGVKPKLGLRVRLSSIAKGKWQNSGGEKSKFGLTATQVLHLLKSLQAAGQLACLQLLHFHMGSQVADIDDIEASAQEVARYYQELRQYGAPIDTIDLGGGISIDYEGCHSNDEFSCNYQFEDYAQTIVSIMARCSQAAGLPQPRLITESGRALTAHHAVLIAAVVDVESTDVAVQSDAVTALAQGPFKTQFEKLLIAAENVNTVDQATTLVQDCDAVLRAAQQAYIRAELDIHDRSAAEQLTLQCYRLLQQAVRNFTDSTSLSAMLDEKLADKYFCNFSLFQSLPDVWGIGQTFPIMPIARLNEPLTHSAILHDLTCDSDGQIGQYVQQGGVKSTMPVHAISEQERYLLGFFLIGAYQEILGDMHNLFGDTNSINVVLHGDGYRLEAPESGDRIDELLSYLHYDTNTLLAQYRLKLERTTLSKAAKQQYYSELAAGLSGYSYLEY